jgi:N-methylhydantoinase A
MRYRGQGGEVATQWHGDAVALEAAFEAQHRALYGFTLDAPVECVTLRVEAIGKVAQPPRQSLPRGNGARPSSTCLMNIEGVPADVPVYDRATLGADDHFSGPAVVSQLDATTLVHAGWHVEVQASGALIMSNETT